MKLGFIVLHSSAFRKARELVGEIKYAFGVCYWKATQTAQNFYY